jgi:hypothetical protein
LYNKLITYKDRYNGILGTPDGIRTIARELGYAVVNNAPTILVDEQPKKINLIIRSCHPDVNIGDSDNSHYIALVLNAVKSKFQAGTSRHKTWRKKVKNMKRKNTRTKK